MQAEAYLFPHFTQAMLELPMLPAYSPESMHTYIPPSKRPQNYWDDISKLKDTEGGKEDAE